MTRLSRRAYLATAAAAMTGLAGCNSAGSDDDTTAGNGSGTVSLEASGTAETPIDSEVAISAATPALMDADPEIVVEGLDAGSSVELTASSEAGDGQTWESKATFEADESGTIRVSEQAPSDGSYQGVHPAGLIWSMKPTADIPPAKAWYGFDSKSDTFEVTVTARKGGRSVAERTLVRRQSAPDVTTKPVGSDDVVGTFVTPDVDDPRPGILVLHGSGGNPWVYRAKMLASHGYPALAVKYFGSEDPIPDRLLEVALSYFDRAADWLRSQSQVRDGDVGVYGVSKGGEGALFLAGYADWVGAVVAMAPSGVAFEGLTAGEGWAGGSSWVVDNEPVPYIPATSCYPEITADGQHRYAAAYECALSKANDDTIADATFSVENCQGPIRCLSGEDDQMWPATRLSAFAVERFRNHETNGQIDHRSYEETGHGMPIPYVPTYGYSKSSTTVTGGTPEANAKASADHWPRALETLSEGLE